MVNHSSRLHFSNRTLHWTARVWSIASVGLIAGFLVGEGINPKTSAEVLGFVFFPVGICVGMILAWWKEGLGGSITIGSLLVFYVIHLATSGTLPHGLAWLAFAIPGFLFVSSWYCSRKVSNPAI